MMGKRWITICILSGLALAGCRSARSPYAEDPTLLYYKPTLNDSATVLAERTTRREPVKPAMPAVAQKSQPLPQMDPTPGPAPQSEIQPVSGSEIKPLTLNDSVGTLPAELAKAQPLAKLEPADPKPLPGALPVSETVIAKLPIADAPSLPAPKPPAPQMPLPPGPARSPASLTRRIETAGRFAHDSEYRWLQGVLEKHPRGYYCLRYADSSVEDPYGGKVRLVDDQRVSQFHDGDVLRIEGGLVSQDDAGPHARWENPYYRVKGIELVQQSKTPK
jgi:hypothetical protein